MNDLILEIKFNYPKSWSKFVEFADSRLGVAMHPKYAPEIFLVEWPFSMQWGVYLEFFDSQRDIDIEITLDVYHSTVIGYIYTIRGCEYDPKDTRTEAQKEAIKKAFYLLESQE